MEMSDVSYVSSAGLRVLIDLQKTCKKINQGEVLLVNIPQRVYETLELAGFVPLFKFYSNVNSALAAFLIRQAIVNNLARIIKTCRYIIDSIQF